MPNQKPNQEQQEFLSAVKSALENESFRKVTFAEQGKSKSKLKSKFELILGDKSRLIKASNNQSDQETVERLEIDALIERFKKPRISPFGSAMLATNEFDLHYAENRKLEPRLYKSKPSEQGAIETHNRQKIYVLENDRPYLQGLGIANKSGKIIKKQYGKFRQIANFVEIMDREIGEFVQAHDAPISILDLGCGKGYLTFATYDYISKRAKMQPDGLGVDLKSDVIGICNELANAIGFSGLKFEASRIDPKQNQAIDILIALHACDTATDDALALGVRSEMKYFFCAPCCQAEIAQQASAESQELVLINDFPLMKRRQADIITDVCRALLLKSLGYNVKFLEFTALEHTSKNVMLAGFKDTSVDRKQAFSEYLALKNAYGFKRHSLEENLKDLLEASNLS